MRKGAFEMNYDGEALHFDDRAGRRAPTWWAMSYRSDRCAPVSQERLLTRMEEVSRSDIRNGK